MKKITKIVYAKSKVEKSNFLSVKPTQAYNSYINAKALYETTNKEILSALVPFLDRSVVSLNDVKQLLSYVSNFSDVY